VSYLRLLTLQPYNNEEKNNPQTDKAKRWSRDKPRGCSANNVRGQRSFSRTVTKDILNEKPTVPRCTYKVTTSDTLTKDT